MTSTISVQQLADQLGISTYAVYKGVEQGSIRHLRMGKRILIPNGEARRLLTEQLQGGPSNGSEAPVSPPAPANATDRLIQAITLQVSTMQGLKADLANVRELLSILVKELTS